MFSEFRLPTIVHDSEVIPDGPYVVVPIRPDSCYLSRVCLKRARPGGAVPVHNIGVFKRLMTSNDPNVVRSAATDVVKRIISITPSFRGPLSLVYQNVSPSGTVPVCYGAGLPHSADVVRSATPDSVEVTFHVARNGNPFDTVPVPDYTKIARASNVTRTVTPDAEGNLRHTRSRLRPLDAVPMQYVRPRDPDVVRSTSPDV